MGLAVRWPSTESDGNAAVTGQRCGYRTGVAITELVCQQRRIVLARVGFANLLWDNTVDARNRAE
jgi:hypothetical protein